MGAINRVERSWQRADLAQSCAEGGREVVGEGRALCQCLPGTEEGSVKLVNHVVATEHKLRQLNQSRAGCWSLLN